MKVTPLKIKKHSSPLFKGSYQNNYSVSFGRDSNDFECSKKHAQNICRCTAIASFVFATLWLIFKKK